MCSRVESPRAANIGAAATKFERRRECFRVTAATPPSRREGKVFFHQLHLRSPTFIVARKRFRPPPQRYSVEAGFGDGQHRATRYFLELEYNKRRELFRIVDCGIDRIRMPSKRKKRIGSMRSITWSNAFPA
jgi:hypothetical protein